MVFLEGEDGQLHLQERVGENMRQYPILTAEWMLWAASEGRNRRQRERNRKAEAASKGNKGAPAGEEQR